MLAIRRITEREPASLEALSRLLQDAVHTGASVGFLAPLGTLAESVYRHHGWQFVGSIPEYAATPDGQLHATSYFYKRIAP